MYRQSQQSKMTIDAAAPEVGSPTCVTRVANWPVMALAVGQVNNVYNNVKERNTYIKATLETAETGVKSVADHALPVVHKFDKPIGSLNNFACSQLDRIETVCPLVTKPTEEVVKDSKDLYAARVQPRVDQVVAAKDNCMNVVSNTTQYSKNVAVNTAQYGIDTVSATKQYGIDKMNATKEYGINTLTATKDYGVDKVSGMTHYTVDKLTAVGVIGLTKLNDALSTPTGKNLATKMDFCVDYADQYVDFFLPEMEKSDENGVACTTGTDAGKPAQQTYHRAGAVCDKIRKRGYKRALKQLRVLQQHSQDAINAIKSYLDLISFAKTHMDSVPTHMEAIRDKMNYLWTEINKTEQDADNIDSNDQQLQQHSAVDMETRLIATARHMTLRLKTAVTALSAGSAALLPTAMADKLDGTRKFTEQLYTDFMQANKLNELPNKFVSETRARLDQLQTTLVQYSSNVTQYASTWMIVDYELENLSLDFGDELGMFEPERPQLNSVPYTLEPINGYKQHYVPFDQRDRVQTK